MRGALVIVNPSAAGNRRGRRERRRRSGPLHRDRTRPQPQAVAGFAGRRPLRGGGGVVAGVAGLGPLPGKGGFVGAGGCRPRAGRAHVSFGFAGRGPPKNRCPSPGSADPPPRSRRSGNPPPAPGRRDPATLHPLPVAAIRDPVPPPRSRSRRSGSRSRRGPGCQGRGGRDAAGSACAVALSAGGAVIAGRHVGTRRAVIAGRCADARCAVGPVAGLRAIAGHRDQAIDFLPADGLMLKQGPGHQVEPVAVLGEGLEAPVLLLSQYPLGFPGR